MKKLLVLLTAVILATSLFGCAGTSSDSTTRVKCPACGHQFDTNPQEPG